MQVLQKHQKVWLQVVSDQQLQVVWIRMLTSSKATADR